MSLKHGSPQYCIGGDLRSYILADRKSRGLFGKPQRTKDVVLMGGRFLESLKKNHVLHPSSVRKSSFLLREAERGLPRACSRMAVRRPLEEKKNTHRTMRNKTNGLLTCASVIR